MKEFMLIYKGGNPDKHMESIPKEEMEVIMARWGAWMEALQQKDKLASGGAPLTFSGKRLNVDGVVTDIAAAEFKELVSGYSIIKADNIDEAIELTRDCPIFINPEIVVEIREIVRL